MHQSDELPGGPVTPEMTLLEVMSRWAISEAIIIAYGAQAGVGLRCHALFDTLAEAAQKYNLDLNKLLGDLNALVQALESPPEKLIMTTPKLACCNFIDDVRQLRAFALDHGFAGVDWTFSQPEVFRQPAAEADFIRAIQSLHPLEVRFHCAFAQTDLGDENPVQAASALRTFQAVCRLVSKLKGRYVTIHIGLGRESTSDLCWERTLAGLSDLVQFANKSWVRLCLENLAWGWTSRPELYEKLLRKSGAWATLDIGHAQVCPSVTSQQFRVADFVRPQPERICNAHVYHAENGNGHIPPPAPGRYS